MEQKQFRKVGHEYIRYLADLPSEAISKIQPLLPYSATLTIPSIYLRRLEDTHIADEHADDYADYLVLLPDVISHPTHVALYPKVKLGVNIYAVVDRGSKMLVVGLQLSSIGDPAFRNTVETMFSWQRWKYEGELKHGTLLEVDY